MDSSRSFAGTHGVGGGGDISRRSQHFCRILIVCASLSVASATLAQQPNLEDAVRNLRNPDPKARFAALQTLRQAGHVEAARPVAALINDSVEEIQLAAIATELSFYLVDDVPARKRLGFLVEVRAKEVAVQAFERGQLATWPSAVPSELTDALLKAVDDESRRVRLEAVYSIGVIGRPPLPDAVAPGLVKAVDHYDPAVRAGAARVLGRLQVTSAGDALVKALNDSNAQVRQASMRALGDLRDERAVEALTEQYKYYGRGEGARAALDALARIGHESSVPLFKSRLADSDEYLRRAAAEGLGRSGDTSELAALRTGATADPSPMVRAAMAFAMQKLGQNYVPRIVDFLSNPRVVTQAQEYLLELGDPIARDLLPGLRDPNPEIRARVAEVFGAIGDASTLPALEPLTKDVDRKVTEAAAQAIERIKMTPR
jgi:HEAT repeat protein